MTRGSRRGVSFELGRTCNHRPIEPRKGNRAAPAFVPRPAGVAKGRTGLLSFLRSGMRCHYLGASEATPSPHKGTLKKNARCTWRPWTACRFQALKRLKMALIQDLTLVFLYWRLEKPQGWDVSRLHKTVIQRWFHQAISMQPIDRLIQCIRIVKRMCHGTLPWLCSNCRR
jgi:hypothetical protein